MTVEKWKGQIIILTDEQVISIIENNTMNMLTMWKMIQKIIHGETNNLLNLSKDVLYSKDVTLDVKAKVEYGINNAILKFKKQQQQSTILSKLTSTAALQSCSVSTYMVHFQE